MNVQNNGIAKKKMIIELQKTQEGYKLKDQYYRVSRKNSLTSSQKKPFYKMPINWEPQNHDFSIKLQKKETLKKLHSEPLSKKTQQTQKFRRQIIKSIPYYSKWFNFQKIHHIEKESLPEYFMEKPSKTPDTYIKARNFIIMLYWNSPKIYLTATACRRCINGDVSAILRIHAFLERWGIINNSYNPTSGNLNRFLKRNFCFSFFKEQKEGGKIRFEWVVFELRKKIVAEIFSALGKNRDICFSCEEFVELVFFEKKRFEGLEEFKKIFICERCFGEEKIPIFYCKEDFRKVEVENLFEDIRKFGFDEKNRVLAFLKNNFMKENFLDVIRDEFKEFNHESILFEIMKIPFNLEMSLLDKKNKFYNENELTYKTNLSDTFKEKIQEIYNFLKNDKFVTEEKKRNILDKKKIIDLEKEEFENFLDNDFLNKVNKKLEYFNKFEKILEHHKKTINYINK